MFKTMNYTNNEILHYLLIIILQYNNKIHIYYLDNNK